MKKTSTIFLTGFMGSGKSTVGRELAHRLGVQYSDVDEIIETRTGRSVSDIFRRDGEEAFRILEKKVLFDLIKTKGGVIALGGGTLMDPENAAAVCRSGFLVYLSAKAATLWNRIKSTNKRPLFQKPDGTLLSHDEALQNFENLLAQRLDGYAKADFTVPAGSKSIDEIVSVIERRLLRSG